MDLGEDKGSLADEPVFPSSKSEGVILNEESTIMSKSRNCPCNCLFRLPELLDLVWTIKLVFKAFAVSATVRATPVIRV